MQILVLGGTQFVGRHIVEALLAAGHQVTTLSRGISADTLPGNVERLRGDRDAGHGGLAALGGRTWDSCIDVSGYTPAQVGPSATLLRGRVRRYVYISAVSVYGDPAERPVRESHARVPPAGGHVVEVTGETYGPLKAACEDIVLGAHAGHSTILRPQVVAGRHDPYDRYSYWVRRAQEGGNMLAPGDGSDHVQVIDAHDVAEFTRRVIEVDLGGVFNLAGPRLSWAEFLRVLGAKSLVWVDAAAAGVTEFELPLFRTERGPRSGLMDVCNQRACAAGLTLSDPAETADRVRAWLGECKLQPALSRQREAELIRAARKQH